MGGDAVLERVLPYLHLARRGGKLAFGHAAVRQSLARGHCRLILRARDAGAYCRRLDTGAVPVRELADRRQLGAWCGRSELAVLGIDDAGLAAGILGRLEGE